MVVHQFTSVLPCFVFLGFCKCFHSLLVVRTNSDGSHLQFWMPSDVYILQIYIYIYNYCNSQKGIIGALIWGCLLGSKGSHTKRRRHADMPLPLRQGPFSAGLCQPYQQRVKGCRESMAGPCLTQHHASTLRFTAQLLVATSILMFSVDSVLQTCWLKRIPWFRSSIPEHNFWHNNTWIKPPDFHNLQSPSPCTSLTMYVPMRMLNVLRVGRGCCNERRSSQGPRGLA